MLRNIPASNLNDVSAGSRASAFSPLVVLAFEQLRLILRRKRADPLPLLWWHCCTLPLTFHSSLRSCKFLRCRLSLSLRFRCSGFGVLFCPRSTHSCQQGSAAFPSFLNSFSTFRADHGTSMSFPRQDHTTPIPPARLR